MDWLSLGQAVLGGGLNVFSNLYNAKQQQQTNIEQMQFQRNMYDLQRRDALSDWNMQNAYNSPKAQMARLKEAGLNPHLVYGNGATALSTSQVRSSSAGGYSPRAPQVDFSGANVLGSYYDLKQKAIGVDAIKQQVELMELDKVNKKIQGLAMLAGVDLKNVQSDKLKFDLDRARQLIGFDLQSAELGVQKKGKEIKALDIKNMTMLDSNDRSWLQTRLQQQKGQIELKKLANDLLQQKLDRAKTQAQTDQIRAAIKKLNQDVYFDKLLKQYEVDLNSKGVQKNDSMVSRALVLALEKLFGFNLQEKHEELIPEDFVPEMQ